MTYPVLLIDDLRDFKRKITPGDLTVARTSQEGLDVLLTRKWEQIWLDHDLGLNADGSEDTIMPVVDFMCERAFNGSPVEAEAILVHTSNPNGAAVIQRSLSAYGYSSIRVNAPEYFHVGG